MKGKQYDATLLNKFLYCSKHYICTVATILSRWYASTVGSVPSRADSTSAHDHLQRSCPNLLGECVLG